jgi:hypothetical protein
MAQPKFEVVEDEPQETTSKAESALTSLLLLNLKTLSQKTLTAAAALFSLLTVASVFWLAMTVIHDPNTYQLVGLGGYAGFILLINWIVRRK